MTIVDDFRFSLTPAQEAFFAQSLELRLPPFAWQALPTAIGFDRSDENYKRHLAGSLNDIRRRLLVDGPDPECKVLAALLLRWLAMLRLCQMPVLADALLQAYGPEHPEPVNHMALHMAMISAPAGLVDNAPQFEPHVFLGHYHRARAAASVSRRVVAGRATAAVECDAGLAVSSCTARRRHSAKSNRLSQEDRAAIERRIAAGAKAADIAVEFNVSLPTVYRYRKYVGVR